MSEHVTYALTSAQRGLFFSQKISPTANLNLSEAVEICGSIKVDLFKSFRWRY